MKRRRREPPGPPRRAEPPRGTPPGAPLWLPALLLALLVLAVYAGARGLGFVNFDDDGYVTGNYRVRAGLSLAGARWALTTFQQGNWHPLTWLSHMLDVQLFGLAAGAHHLVSVGLHAANTVLLFLLLQALTGLRWRSAAVAALFAVHPLHVESVAWVAERKDVLSTLLALLALGAYLRHLRAPSGWRLAPAAALYALGLAAKPMLVTLPLLMLLLDWWPLGRVRIPGPPGVAGAALREKIPFFCLAGASGVVTLLAQHRGGTVVPLGDTPAGARLANAFLAIARYLGKVLWPAGLAVFYPHPEGGVSPGAAAAAALLVAAVTAVALRAARRAPWLVFGWLWFLVGLAPVIGIVQVGSQALADRYAYLPLAGLLVLLAWGASAAGSRVGVPRWALALGLLAALAASSVAAARQVSVWRDSATLFAHAVAVTEDNWLAQDKLAEALDDEGRAAEAVPRYEEALRLRPGFAQAHVNLGGDLAVAGRRRDARWHFEEALRLDPDSAEAHNGLGVVLGSLGMAAEAARHFEAALAARPEYPSALLNLGVNRLQAGDPDGAIRLYREVLRLEPGSAEARNNLGRAYETQGRRTEALAEYREALRLRPDFRIARENERRALAAGP
jgi:tetratricopeptide (TPR) repeat protein